MGDLDRYDEILVVGGARLRKGQGRSRGVWPSDVITRPLRQTIVVAVASNVAHANTAALAQKVADVFAEQK